MSDFDVIRAKDNVSERAVRDEVNRRTCKAGYTDRDGQPMIRKIMTTVPFGKVKLNIWPRDKNGNLIDD